MKENSKVSKTKAEVSAVSEPDVVETPVTAIEETTVDYDSIVKNLEAKIKEIKEKKVQATEKTFVNNVSTEALIKASVPFKRNSLTALIQKEVRRLNRKVGTVFNPLEFKG